jgi:preprotein translocase subunit SecE
MEIMDKFKALLAVVLIAAGIVGFYALPADQEALRILACMGGVLLAAVMLWFSAYGRSFINYARDSIKEAQKVVWPSRKETWQTTAMVFIFVTVLALFMWLVDSGLSWIMYDLLLGQK